MGMKVTTADGVTHQIKGTTKATKGAPKSKRPGANNGPARQRYRTSNRLMEKKIKNLMRYCKMTRAQATLRWMNTRTRGRHVVTSSLLRSAA